MNRIARFHSIYICSAGFILWISAALKAVSAFSGGEYLNITDPVFGMSNRFVLCVVSVVEFFVAGYLLCSKNLKIKLWTIAGLCICFIGYRLVLFSEGSPKTCPCLGTVLGHLSIGPEVAESLATGMLVYLFLGAGWAICTSKNFRREFRLAEISPADNIPVIYLAAVLFSFGTVTATSGEQPFSNFEIEGTVEARFHLLGTQAQPVQRFKMVVSGDRWWIRSQKERVDAIDYHEFFYEGGQVHFLDKLNEEMLAKEKKAKGHVNNVANGAVYVGNVPYNPFFREAGPVWLAFASARYLKSVGTRSGIVEPAFIQDGSGISYLPPTNLKLQAEWAFHGESEAFLSDITYYDDGLERRADGKLSGRRKSDPYDQGFTNAHYYVESCMDIGGIKVPSSAWLLIYRPKTNATSSSDLSVYSDYHIKLVKFSTNATDLGLPPPLPGVSMIADFRKSDEVGMFTYAASNKWFSIGEISTNSAFLNYKQRLDEMARNPPAYYGTPTSSSLLRIILISLAIFPLVVLAVKYYKHQQQHRKTK